jgi:hypothetical protein
MNIDRTRRSVARAREAASISACAGSALNTPSLLLRGGKPRQRVAHHLLKK